MTTQQPTGGNPPNLEGILGEPNGEYVPEGLELLQAHWFARHGERTPVRKRMTNAGFPERWNFCYAGREFNAAILKFQNDGETLGSSRAGNVNAALGPSPPKGELRVKRLVETTEKGNEPRLRDPGECYFGELTDLGRQSTLKLGRQLRKLYIEKLDFLPSTSISDDLVSFRSTHIPRTIESLQQIITGLLGDDTENAPVLTPDLHERGKGVGGPRPVSKVITRELLEESLNFNTFCGRLRHLDKATVEGAARKYNPYLAEFDSKVQKYVGGPLRIEGHPRANGVLDTIAASRAHGVPVPKALLDPDFLRTLEEAVVHEWFDGYFSHEFTRLAMGRLFGDLLTRMEHKARAPSDPLKLAIYSCHDTSLGGMLAALKAFDQRWPPFTSHICIELFRASSPSSMPSSSSPSESSTIPKSSSLSSYFPSFFGGSSSSSSLSPLGTPHYVRLRYNGNTIRLPTCAPEGKHLEGSEGKVCTMEAFKEAVQDIVMAQEDWEKECGAKPL